MIERSRVRILARPGANFPLHGVFCVAFYFGIRSTVTAIVRKKIPVILPKVQVAVTAKHTCTLSSVASNEVNTVNWCMVVWYSKQVR